MPGEQFKFEGVRSNRVLIPGEFLHQVKNIQALLDELPPRHQLTDYYFESQHELLHLASRVRRTRISPGSRIAELHSQV